jgi:hypothetical protein
MFAILYFLLAAILLFAVLRLVCGSCVMGEDRNATPSATRYLLLPVMTLGWALSLFLVASYVLCVGFDLIFPGYAMYEAWIDLMPGMTWISWPSFLLGLTWAFLYGWYTALLFGALFNAAASRA